MTQKSQQYLSDTNLSRFTSRLHPSSLLVDCEESHYPLKTVIMWVSPVRGLDFGEEKIDT